MSSDWTGAPCAASSAPPTRRNCRSRTGSGPRCWTTTPTTCTGAGPRAAPTPPPWPRRSPPWATAAAIRTVRTYLHPLRSGRPVPPPTGGSADSPRGHQTGSCAAQTPSTPTSRPASSRFWRTAHSCDAAATHVAAFAEMMCGRHGDRLDTWLAAVEADTARTVAPLRHRAAPRLRRRPCRTDPRTQLRTRRRHRQQDQNDQAADVRASQLRPPPHPRPPRPLTYQDQRSITPSAPEPFFFFFLKKKKPPPPPPPPPPKKKKK